MKIFLFLIFASTYVAAGDSTQPISSTIVLNQVTEPKLITLKEAIVASEKYAVQNLLAKLTTQKKKDAFRSSWGYFLPKLNISGGLTGNFPEVKFNAFKALGDLDTGATPSTVLTPKMVGTASFSINIPVIDPAAISAAMSANNALKSQQLLQKNTKETITVQAISLYFQAHLGKQNLAMTKKQLNRAAEHRDSVKERVKAGVVRLLELDRAELEVLRAKDAASKARENYKQHIGALGLLIGESDEFSIHAPDLQAVSIDKPPALIEDALRNRPDYLAAKLSLAAARDARMQGYMSYLPKIAFSAAANYNSNAQGLNPNNWTGMVGLAANWNIYDGGIREANISQTAANVAQNRIQLENLRDAIAGGINALHLNFQVSHRALRTVVLEKKLAKSVQQETVRQFLAGAKSSWDVIDANLNLFRAEISLDATHVQADLSYLRLMQAAGRLNEVVNHLMETPPSL